MSEPSGSVVALGDAVAAMLAEGGPISRAEAAYHERPQQLAMARAVAQAIEQSETLVVEAGTGVGKTYAYLIPLLLSGRRGLVSTATKGLQDQLFWRDLPRLMHLLGVPVSVALLKGRSSYLCLHRLSQARQLPQGLDRNSMRQLARVESWASTSETGDLSEVEGLDERAAILPLISSTRDNCLGSDCPSFAQCHVVAARRKAMAAELVVVNHHLFFADLSLKEDGIAELLPSVEVVVFDEAHQILDTGLQFMATALSTLALQDLARDVLALGLQHARGLQDWAECSEGLERAIRSLLLASHGVGSDPLAQRGSRRLRWSERASGTPQGQARPVEVAFAQALTDVLNALRAAQGACAALADHQSDFGRLADRADVLAQRCQDFAQVPQVDRVRWIDLGSHHVRLIDTPLDIAEVLTAARTSTRRAWICTSATLGSESELQWFRRQSGTEDARALCVGSPYDYAHHAKLWIPEHLPLPQESGHLPAVAQLAARCAARLGGRTFVLVTTLRALPQVAEHLREALIARGRPDIEVLVQGEQPKRSLLDRFRQAQAGAGAVLVGAQSFWEGIDVTGDDLQCVLIDKLPFPPPDDPLLEARSKAIRAQGRDPFDEIFLAETAVALKQGAGRLIRSENDRGLLVLCDRRLRTKGYGRRLLSALPPMESLADGHAVLGWLQELQPPPV